MRRSVRLLAEKPNIATIEVRINYPCNTADDVFKPCESVKKDDCEGAPADSLNAVCTPVHGGPDGWDYEEGNNVIFFAGDSVPGLHSQIEIQYYPEGLGP